MIEDRVTGVFQLHLYAGEKMRGSSYAMYLHLDIFKKNFFLLWTLGRVYAMVSAVKYVSLMIHKPVFLEQIIHYMLIKIINNKTKQTNNPLPPASCYFSKMPDILTSILPLWTGLEL